MKHIAFAVVATAAGLLAGCTEKATMPDGSPDTCGASQYQYLMGATAQEVEAIEFTQPVRVIPHDGIVTLDFNEKRLNFNLSEAGIVEMISCG
ncbi:I78 family peptidase inhibitor [Pseudoruegeria sp. HB172150]|uniref:I78 family peptidase inhibitor n=1 Tax=Pseudoruegeria sp. HB172150 TaxID=2721164 RepID=UPI0015577007|nr:I78 family peptidase inhibitor [Pseudoruegeria sp. HB172150]